MEQTPQHAVIGTPEYEAQLKVAVAKMKEPKAVVPPTGSPMNHWANFFANERLTPESVGPQSTLVLMDLCKKLAETGSPFHGKGINHESKIAARRLAVNTAMDMGIDLMKMRKPGRHRGTKPAMGAGLLAVWNEEYAKRFGSTVGTAGAFEIVRRKVSGNLATERQKEEMSKRRQVKEKEIVTTRCPKCGAEDHFGSIDEVTSRSIEIDVPANLYCDACNTVMEIV